MKTIYLVICVILLSSCSTAYQKDSFTGGFTTAQLDENVFQVSFRGNGYTSRDKANDFALLRSAEVALENGFNYFVIVDANQYDKKSSYTTPTTVTTTGSSNTQGTVNAYGNTANYSGTTYGRSTSTVNGGQTINLSKPHTTNTIVCYNGKPQGFAYNAKYTAQSLKAKHEISNE